MKPQEGDAATPGDEIEEARDLVELVLEDHARGSEAPRRPERIDGVVVGVLTAISADGHPMVSFEERPDGPVAARATMPVAASDVGRACALLFEGAKPERPILMGWMFEPTPASEPVLEPPVARAEPGQPIVERDGERLVFEAEKEIVLRCGQASITLTRAGKILIRGVYVLTRSSGVNRIQGGSVQIN